VIAELVMQAASTGTVVFPDGKKMDLSPKDWLDLVWKLYGQIDGPPPKAVDVTSRGEQITGPGVFLPQVEDDET
jgi:hypothetical protein